jgi:hypothetical protein
VSLGAFLYHVRKGGTPVDGPMIAVNAFKDVVPNHDQSVNVSLHQFTDDGLVYQKGISKSDSEHSHGYRKRAFTNEHHGFLHHIVKIGILSMFPFLHQRLLQSTQ